MTLQQRTIAAYAPQGCERRLLKLVRYPQGLGGGQGRSATAPIVADAVLRDSSAAVRSSVRPSRSASWDRFNM